MLTPNLLLRFLHVRIARAMVIVGAMIATAAASAAAAAEPTGAQAQTAGPAQAAGVEFSGYMRTGSEHRFILTNPERLTASGWLAVGQAFDAYTVESYEAERETLTVRKGGTAFHLLLVKDPSVKDARLRSAVPVRAPPSALPGLRIVVLGDGRLLVSGEMIDSFSLGARLQQHAALHPDVARFKLTTYQSIDGDRTLVEKSTEAIRTMLATLPQDIRRRFPYVEVKPLPAR